VAPGPIIASTFLALLRLAILQGMP
jgi:hypothetical protein